MLLNSAGDAVGLRGSQKVNEGSTTRLPCRVGHASSSEVDPRNSRPQFTPAAA